MTAERIVAVVEIERVRGGAVDERSIERAHALVVAEHTGEPGGRAQRTCDDPRGGIAASGDRDADGVEDADLGPVHCLRR